MYASTARSVASKQSATCQAGIAAIFSSLIPIARQDLQCCEKTNWLPRAHPTRRLAQFPQLWGKEPLRALVQPEPVHAVLEDVGNEREDRPPVAGRAGRGPGFGDRIATGPEEQVVHDRDDGCIRFVTRDLAQPRHACLLYG